jgi:LmbE family N-acetylglucosaminyl deacetylase
VPELWLMAFPQPTIAVDITANFDRKMAALKSHRSQVGDGDHLEVRLREWTGGTAASAGLPEGRLAESFRVVVAGLPG